MLNNVLYATLISIILVGAAYNPDPPATTPTLPTQPTQAVVEEAVVEEAPSTPTQPTQSAMPTANDPAFTCYEGVTQEVIPTDYCLEYHYGY